LFTVQFFNIMNTSKFLVAAFLLAAFCLAPSEADAQRSRIVRGLGSLARKAAVSAVTSATVSEVRQFFNETPANRSPITIYVTNNYSGTVTYQVSLDGYNWYNYTPLPGYYHTLSSGYQGAIAIHRNGYTYLVSSSGSYNVSGF
jgi:hypothetical protein